MPTAVIKLMIINFVSIYFSLPKPKQTVREVIEDIDAFLEELLDAKDDGCQQLKVNNASLWILFMFNHFSDRTLVCKSL